MSLIVDLIIVAIMLLFIFLGYKRGLVKVAFKLCTFFVAIIVAFVLYKPISNLVIEKTNFDESIEECIVGKILPENSAGNTDITDNEVNFAKKLPDFILKNSENTVISISNSISTKIIETGTLLAIFIIVKLALKLLTALADLIAKLPIINQFNKIGGTIYGVVEGLFIISIGFAIISLISPMLDQFILSSIDNSVLGSILYNNNIILKFIM